MSAVVSSTIVGTLCRFPAVSSAAKYTAYAVSLVSPVTASAKSVSAASDPELPAPASAVTAPYGSPALTCALVGAWAPRATTT